MKSVSLYQWDLNITVTVLDIISCPVFCLKDDILETELCIRHQAESTQLGPIDRASHSLEHQQQHQ
jgi:hypothetical protein